MKINRKFIFIALGILSISIFSFFTFAPKVDVGLEIGQTAPEIKAKSMDGKLLELKSYRGQVVLIDFWASWCGPCRYENPSVVAAYNKFKDKQFTKGSKFTVFSVSVDQNESAWRKAVADDKLVWKSNVIEGNSGASATYNIQFIPTNFLIDQNGVIIAKNLRGEQLEVELQKIIK